VLRGPATGRTQERRDPTPDGGGDKNGQTNILVCYRAIRQPIPRRGWVTSALPIINLRDGRNWPISRRKNLRLRWLDPVNRQPRAPSQPHRRLDQTRYPSEPCGCGTRWGNRDGHLHPYPEWQSPILGRNSRPSSRTALYRLTPYPRWPESRTPNLRNLRRYKFSSTFRVKHRLTFEEQQTLPAATSPTAAKRREYEVRRQPQRRLLIPAH
jgi:hypothetical protein